MRNITGALLIEALVAFGLMFTVSLVALGLQAHTRKARAKGRDIVAATCLARGVLEQAQSIGYDALPYGETNFNQTVQVVRENQSLPEKFVVLQNVRTGPSNTIKSIFVTVKWNSGVVNLEGYVTK